jgi:hypothetical protein
MKRRVRRIANFFAFNLLFFALYLNFIHKDKVAAPIIDNGVQRTAAFSGPGTSNVVAAGNTVVAGENTTSEDGGQPLRLSIN